jgi:aldehyde:ferredoxin oxidoreductase
MLKYAGWDGIVIEGQADEPVWLDIRNDTVAIRNCSKLSLWGTDTWESRQSASDRRHASAVIRLAGEDMKTELAMRPPVR